MAVGHKTGLLAAIFPLTDATGVFAERVVAVEQTQGVAGIVSIDPTAAAVLDAMSFFFEGFGFFLCPSQTSNQSQASMVK